MGYVALSVSESQVEYLLALVDDRVEVLERRARQAITPQETDEIQSELEKANRLREKFRST